MTITERQLENIPTPIAPLAIVNLSATSRPDLAIKYFADPNKVVGFFDGLETGVAVGTPRELADLILAFHHDKRAKRNCRTAVISVQTPENPTSVQLADADRRLLHAAKDFQKLMRKFCKVCQMLGWTHGNTGVRHMHIIWANSNGRRTLDLRPEFLRELQDMLWTHQFKSGRGKGKGRAIPGYCNYLKLPWRARSTKTENSSKVAGTRW